MSTVRLFVQIEPHLPKAPPCFESRSQWVEYLRSAAEAQRRDKDGPIRLVAGEPARLNSNYSFCADCNAAHRRAMVMQRRCVPHWLLQLEPAHAA